jgi:hypothetical protein
MTFSYLTYFKGGTTFLPPPMGLPPFGLPPPPFNVPGMPNFSAPGMAQLPGNLVGFPMVSVASTLGQPQMDQTEIIFRARADIYRRDLREIHSIPELMKYSKTPYIGA